LRRSHFPIAFRIREQFFLWSGACVCKSFFPSYVLRTKVSIHRQIFFADGRCHVSETRVLVPEPWLRGTLRDVPAVHRGVLHALQLAQEDLGKWCRPLAEEQLKARPGGLPPVAFHLRHIARSMDRLLTYAEEGHLGEAQVSALKSEWDAEVCGDALFAEIEGAFARSAERVRALASTDLGAERAVGKKQLPTTLGGLLVHVADHTQRHVGQAITTAKVVASMK
jgi:uncharacterized damage-inducible protein DinB